MKITNISGNKEQLPNVHCLVHPGFDSGEHEEFEAYIHTYIEHIAKTTHDVLLIVSDGESFDVEQIQKFTQLDILDSISSYLGLHDGGIGDFIDIYDENGEYNQIIANDGLSEDFYKWCQKNIDMSELLSIANEWRNLRDDHVSGIYKGNEHTHDTKAALLRKREEEARMQLDILNILNKALDEFGVIGKRNMTHRSVKNKGRFFRIFQHAIKVLGKERVKEIFIADGEYVDSLPIQPVSAFQIFEGDLVSTSSNPSKQKKRGQVFNASEECIYGNSAELRDKLTYELSVTRHQKLAEQQPKEVLKNMGVEVTSDTKFVFLGEYRNRCVNNVFRIMNYRLSPLSGDNFYIAHDAFTLERPDDHMGTDWF